MASLRNCTSNYMYRPTGPHYVLKVVGFIRPFVDIDFVDCCRGHIWACTEEKVT
jgi:hypothetical protein